MRESLLCSVMALMLATCAAPAPTRVPQPFPQPPVSNEPPPPPAPVEIVQPAGEWLDWPLAKGQWVYRTDDRGSIALFGVAGKDALVTLRCDKARRILFLSRAGLLKYSRMTIRTSYSFKTFETQNTGSAPHYVATEIAPTDPILDAMAFSRGRIAVQAYGELFIAIPVWAEIGRVVQDCRN